MDKFENLERGQPLPQEKLDLLRGLIEANKFNKKDLANLIGLSEHAIRNALNGKKVSRLTMSKINLFIKQNQPNEKGELGIAQEKSTSPRSVSEETITMINQFMALTGLKKIDLANMVGMKKTSFSDALSGKKLTERNRIKVEQFRAKLKNLAPKQKIVARSIAGAEAMSIEEINQRAERIKHLLLALYPDLSFFINSEEARAVFQQTLDLGDVGYISSLLIALCGTEVQFRSWLEFNTYQFNFFKKKG